MYLLYGWYYGWYDEQKLKTGLRLSVNRIKLTSRKRTDIVQKARQEIAEYIDANRYDRARIRVEQIILEEYFVEGMDFIEMYCDLLLSRFGLIESLEHCDESLMEAVTSVIWATPRMLTECPDLQTVSEHFIYKYGEEFGEQAKSNTTNKVNERVLSKFSTTPPSKLLIEKYLIEIAKSFDVPFTPDTKVFDNEEAASTVNGGPGYIGFEAHGSTRGFSNGSSSLCSTMNAKSFPSPQSFPTAPHVSVDDLPDVPFNLPDVPYNLPDVPSFDLPSTPSQPRLSSFKTP